MCVVVVVNGRALPDKGDTAVSGGHAAPTGSSGSGSGSSHDGPSNATYLLLFLMVAAVVGAAWMYTKRRASAAYLSAV